MFIGIKENSEFVSCLLLGNLVDNQDNNLMNIVQAAFFKSAAHAEERAFFYATQSFFKLLFLIPHCPSCANPKQKKSFVLLFNNKDTSTYCLVCTY